MAAASKHNIVGKGSGKQRRFGGKMGKRVKVRGGYVLVMRSHTHGGGRPAAAGFEANSTHFAKGAVETKALPGRFKVGAPTKREHRRGFYRSAEGING